MQDMQKQPCANDNSYSWASAAKASQGRKQSEKEYQKERLSPPSLSAHCLHLPAVSERSLLCCYQNSLFLPHFDEWPVFLLKCSKSVKYSLQSRVNKGMTIAYNLRGKDYTNSLSLHSQIGPEAPCWFYAKEKHNYWKQRWDGKSATERGWREGGTKQLEGRVREREVKMRDTEAGRQNKAPWNGDRKWRLAR